MTHPTDIPALQALLGTVVHDDLPTISPGGPISEDAAEEMTAAIASGVDEAQASGSIVPACGILLDKLAPHVAVLQLKTARVLAGAAHLVLTNSWLGRGGEADTVRDAARARIASLGG